MGRREGRSAGGALKPRSHVTSTRRVSQNSRKKLSVILDSYPVPVLVPVLLNLAGNSTDSRKSLLPVTSTLLFLHSLKHKHRFPSKHQFST